MICPVLMLLVFSYLISVLIFQQKVHQNQKKNLLDPSMEMNVTFGEQQDVALEKIATINICQNTKALTRNPGRKQENKK